MSDPAKRVCFEHFPLCLLFSSDDQSIARDIFSDDMQRNLEATDFEAAALTFSVMREAVMRSALFSVRIHDVTLQKVKVSVEECMGCFLREEAEILTFLIVVGERDTEFPREGEDIFLFKASQRKEHARELFL